MSSSSRDPGLTTAVRRGVAWSAMSNVVLRAGSFVVGIVLARILTPGEFGVYAVALTVQAVLMTLADLGLSADLIRADDPERRAPTVGALGLASGGVLAATMAVTAGEVAGLLGSPESADVIALLSVTLLLAGAGVVPYAMLQREFRQRALFGIAAVDFVVSTVLTVGLLLAGWGVISLAVGRIAAQSVALALQFRVSGVRPRYRADRQVARSVLRFGLPIAGANMLSWALLNLDNVVIARLAGPVALGFYVLAFNVSNWPMSAIGQVVRSVALPAFAVTRDGPSRDGDLARGTAVTWALALPSGVALAALASPLVRVVYGDRWAPAVPVLVALGLFGALRVVFDLVVAFLLANGSSRSVLAIQALWLVALIPAMVVGTRWQGIAGGGWAHLVVAVTVIVPAYLLALRRVGVRVRTVLAASWPPLPAALLAGLAGHWVSSLAADPAAGLALGALAGAATYGLVLGPWLRGLARAAAPSYLVPPPRVSVVIPCYNYADYLADAVGSALGQQGCDVEVVIVDDASTDESLAVARRLAADPRVRVLAHDTNQGPVDSFNHGLERATGEYLVRLDADDLLTPGSLARAAAVCRARPEVGLVYGHPIHFEGDPPPARTTGARLRVWRGKDWLEMVCRTGVNVVTAPEAFMRMSLVRRLGGQRPLAHTHDMEMWLRLAAFSDVAYLEGVDQAWHREHAASLSQQAGSPLGLTILRERLAAFDVLFDGPAGCLPEAPRLRALARRTLATEALERACYEYDRGRAPSRDVTPLRDFAAATWPDAPDLPEWHALAARVEQGDRWARRRPWLRLLPVRRTLDDWWCHRRWSSSGFFRHPRTTAVGRRVRAHRSRPPVGDTDQADQLEGSTP